MTDRVHVRSEHNAHGYDSVSTAVLRPEGTLQVTARFAVIYGIDQVIGYQCTLIEARLNGALVTDPDRARRLAARAGIPEPPMMTWVDGPAARQDEEMTRMTDDRDLTQVSPEEAAGRELRRLREARRWSQEQVARRMDAYGYDWHQTMVAKTEAAERPLRLNEMAAMCDLFGITPAGLLTAVPCMTDEALEAQASARAARLEDRIARARRALDDAP